jgi:hypothetical protein
MTDKYEHLQLLLLASRRQIGRFIRHLSLSTLKVLHITAEGEEVYKVGNYFRLGF